MREERLVFSGGGIRSVPVETVVEPPAPSAVATAPPAVGDDRAFTFLLLFTGVLFLRPQDMIPPLEYLHLAEMMAIASLVALVVGRLWRQQPITRVTPELVAVLAFGAVILGTAPFSIWPGGSIAVFTDLYAKVILIYLLAVNAVSSRQRLERLTWLLVLAVGYVGFRAMLDYIRGVNLVGRGTRVQGSVGGMLQNPNDLAMNMVVFLPLAVLFALDGRTRLRRLIAALCAVGMVGAIVASGSRGGFLGMATMMLVLVLVQVRRRPVMVVSGILILFCVLPILPDSYWRRIASITDRTKDDFGTEDARETLMREAWRAYGQNLFVGVGAGEFKNWDNANRQQTWRETHNVWLQAAAELGTVGVVVFFCVVTGAIVAVYQTRRLLRGGRRKRDGPRPALPDEDLAWIDAHSAAVAASLAGWLMCAFFASLAYNWTFYYLLALAATPRDILRAALPRPARTSPAATTVPRRAVLGGVTEVRA